MNAATFSKRPRTKMRQGVPSVRSKRNSLLPLRLVSAGTKRTPSQIESPLGAGDMGEAYRQYRRPDSVSALTIVEHAVAEPLK